MIQYITWANAASVSAGLMLGGMLSHLLERRLQIRHPMTRAELDEFTAKIEKNSPDYTWRRYQADLARVPFEHFTDAQFDAMQQRWLAYLNRPWVGVIGEMQSYAQIKRHRALLRWIRLQVFFIALRNAWAGRAYDGNTAIRVPRQFLPRTRKARAAR